MSNLITAKVIADSVAKQSGIRMTTLEIEYPRFILAEVNTHRILSKNSASSRAIPIQAMHKHIIENTAMPTYWGMNQAGMQAKAEINPYERERAEKLWFAARDSAIYYSQQLAGLDLHKQIVNRTTEPYMLMKTVISGTEWNNFFWLRAHEAAQPEFHDLAVKMRTAMDESTPECLEAGEWHLPYVRSYKTAAYGQVFVDSGGYTLSLDEARIISASCCAQVSYRKNDDTFEKAKKIYSQLIESSPCHASPIEHQATPMDECEVWPEGMTHIDKHGFGWSGNLRGWIQFRKLISGESVYG